MTMVLSDNGKWYGTLECLLVRIDPPDDNYIAEHTVTLIGTRSPLGGIMVLDTKGLVPQPERSLYGPGSRVVEASVSWWEAQGFSITMPKMFWEVRESHLRREGSEISKTPQKEN